MRFMEFPDIISGEAYCGVSPLRNAGATQSSPRLHFTNTNDSLHNGTLKKETLYIVQASVISALHVFGLTTVRVGKHVSMLSAQTIRAHVALRPSTEARKLLSQHSLSSQAPPPIPGWQTLPRPVNKTQRLRLEPSAQHLPTL